MQAEKDAGAPLTGRQVDRSVRPRAIDTSGSGHVIGSYSAAELRGLLREKSVRLGSQKALAKEAGISESFLADVLSGNREPSGRLLEFLNVRRTTRYEVYA